MIHQEVILDLMKPKITIVNISEEEIKFNDNLTDTIKKQNKIAINKRFHLRIMKRIVKEIKNNNLIRKKKNERNFVIIEADEKIYELLLNKRKRTIEKIFCV
ncbi:hypothetical protein ACFW04_014502 [Cataglyphis niger]